MEEMTLSLALDGIKRHRAFKRFAELQRQYPNIEIIKDINKKHWEK